MPSRFIWAAAAALVPLAALILGTLWKQSTAPSSHAVAVLERHSIGRDLLSMPSSEENSYGYFLHRAWLSRPKPDVTAVILNWARFPNVLDIVAVLCHPILAETIAEIFVWNNAPQKITVEDFALTGCPRSRLRIHNSVENVYFQARFMACAEAGTPFCFIQDDDFIILPEIIQAMHARMRELKPPHAIYVLPAHEYLSSVLRRAFAPKTPPHVTHTSFSWLGHGALVPRTDAVALLSLMRALNASESEFRMADNYFALLANVVPEVWLDQSIELGGGQAFTIGTEGDQRNQRHILRAGELLDGISACDHGACSRHAYVNTSAMDTQERLHTTTLPTQAVCRGRPCILETNIRLLPDLEHTVDSAREILDLERRNMAIIGEYGYQHFVDFSLCRAVDGTSKTAFKSPNNGKAGDYLSVDLLRATRGPHVLLLLVDRQMLPLLLTSSVKTSLDGLRWDTRHASWQCKLKADTGLEEELQECGAGMKAQARRVRHVRLVLTEDASRPWHVYDIVITEAR